MTVNAKEEFATKGYTVLPQLFSGEEVLLYKEAARTILEQNVVGKEGVYLGMAVASPLFKEAA
ncbi:MAG: hypothetical protein K0Q73_5825, partial [Paenibacillus sp.]|nr:hypothetical protein [Paenibacillus sp.]